MLLCRLCLALIFGFFVSVWAEDIAPEDGVLGEIHVYWQFPSSPSNNRHHSSNRDHNNVEGILTLYHGCGHRGDDWFKLPEERIIIRKALAYNLAVVAFSAKAAERGYAGRCWTSYWPPDENDEALGVALALREWQKIHGISHDLPVYGIGASSGSVILSILMHIIDFSAICLQIAPGLQEAYFDYEDTFLPPIVYLHMPRYTMTAKVVSYLMDTLAENDVEAMELTADPKPLTRAWMSDRIETLGRLDSDRIYEFVKRKGFLDTSDYLKEDPRTSYIMHNLLEADGLQHTVDLHKAELEEEFNILYARHELTSEYIHDILRYFMLQAASKTN